MAYQEIGGELDYIKYSECVDGQVLVPKRSKYIKTTTSKFNKPQYHFKTPAGKIVVLNSSGVLDNAMAGVDPGTEMWITYKGTTELKTGPFKGKDCHQFKILEDKPEEAEEAEAENDDDLPI